MKIFLLFIAASLSAAGSGQTSRYAFSRPQMGTEFRISLYAGDSLLAAVAAEAAFQKIASLEQSMSDYREDSDISRLSATAGSGRWVALSNDLRVVLAFGKTVSKKTGGAFDMTAGALTRLWRRAFRQKEFPAPTDINNALHTVGYKSLHLKKRKGARLAKPAMRIDLGGIAKGYAVDEALNVLKAHGINCALVDGGGDLAAGTAPPGTAGWQVEYFISAGETRTKFIENMAAAASGSTYRFLEWEGKRYSHIIDPRTGMGITSRKIVTVFAPTCMEADAWATAASAGISEKRRKRLSKKGISVIVAEE